MWLDDEKTNKINNLLDRMSKDIVSPADLERFITFLLKTLEKSRGEFDNITKETLKKYKESVYLIEESNKKWLNTQDEKTGEISKQFNEKLENLKNILKEVKKIKSTPGKNGKDADEEVIIDKVLGKIVLPEYKETVLDTATQVRDKLETLKDNERLDITAIKGWEGLLKKVKGKSVEMVAGGARFISQLFDVKLTNLSNGNTLAYNSTTGMWENSAGGSGDMTVAVYDPATIEEQLVGLTATQTLTNKRITARVLAVESHATPTINTDNYDAVDITALAEAITSMTTNLSGTPTNKQKLTFEIKDDGTARAITWGASFVAGGVALPTTTVASKILTVGFQYSTANSLNKWRCVAMTNES